MPKKYKYPRQYDRNPFSQKVKIETRVKPRRCLKCDQIFFINPEREDYRLCRNCRKIPRERGMASG